MGQVTLVNQVNQLIAKMDEPRGLEPSLLVNQVNQVNQDNLVLSTDLNWVDNVNWPP